MYYVVLYTLLYALKGKDISKKVFSRPATLFSFRIFILFCRRGEKIVIPSKKAEEEEEEQEGVAWEMWWMGFPRLARE